MNIFYLDAPGESGTISILSELGVDVSTTKNSMNISLESPSINFEVAYDDTVTYLVKNNPIYLDVRDDADCWLRCKLVSGNKVCIPSGLYHRFNSIRDETGNLISAANTIDTFGNKKGIICTKRYPLEADSVIVSTYHTTRELVCKLCRQFFLDKWVTGTGGSICIRHGNRIYMTPSGVQKELIEPEDLFVLDKAGSVLALPVHKPGRRAPKLSDCAPLFLHAFQQRGAGAVLHSHAYSCNLATTLFEGEDAFRISHQEMIKGITGHGYFDELVVPIIENTAWEHELADTLGDCIRNNPKTVAVLVRRHGMYVWGKTWEEAKRHGECLHYLFEVAINMRRLGLSFLGPPAPVTIFHTKSLSNGASNGHMEVEESAPALKRGRVGNSVDSHANGHGKSKHKAVLFDIEGTMAPISFVKEVLFPYSSKEVKNFLSSNWNKSDVRSIVSDLMDANSKETSKDAPMIRKKNADEVAKYCSYLIKNDQKVTPLKNLQGMIWEAGYSSGELTAELFDDVKPYLQRLSENGTKIAIYSSGSRNAQRLFFKHSKFGDLRSYISCYFDTKTGQKKEASSYKEIIQSLGVDDAADILFLTDVVAEAEAAKAAGMDVIISVRPGNAPITDADKSAFTTVENFNSM